MVEHKKVKAPEPDLFDELQNKVAIVSGVTVISSTEPDGTTATDVEVEYVDTPTNTQKTDVEDVLKKRGLIK